MKFLASSFWNRFIVTTAVYLILISFTYYLLLFLGYSEKFTTSQLLFFDAENYQKIAINGYSEKWLTAFFPLFPALWSLGLNVIAISVLNAFIYIFSISWLCWKFKTSWYVHLIFLTFPSMIFFFLPYSESLFFLFASMLLLGLKKENLLLIFLGSFFAALTRPTIAVFIPAFWLVSIVTKDNKETFNWRTPVIGSLGSLLGLCLVVVIHAAYLGEWFTFFEAQKLWGNELQVPSFPLSSWSGNNMVKIDATAFWVGLSSGIFLLFKIFSSKETVELNKPVAFSLLYLSGTVLMILIYRGGMFFSLNRFIFATPFFLLVLHWLFTEVKWKKWYFLILAFVLVAFAFGAYVHIQAFLKWLLLAGFLCIFVFSLIYNSSGKSKGILRPIVLIGLFFVFIFFLWRFLEGEWIG